MDIVFALAIVAWELFSPINIEEISWAKTSWYGPELQGRPMANGDRFDPTDPTTVAHKDLPFGTEVVLINPQTASWITAEVRDRGPFVGNRQFDLSQAGAQELGFECDGVVYLLTIITSPREPLALRQRSK